MGLTHSFAADEAENAPTRTFSARALPDDETLILRKKPRRRRSLIRIPIAMKRLRRMMQSKLVCAKWLRILGARMRGKRRRNEVGVRMLDGSNSEVIYHRH